MAPPTALLEISYYVGNYMSGILEGVILVVYFMTMYFLLQDPHRHGNKFFMAYSTALVVFTTIDNAFNSLLGQLMWINYRDGPGGPIGYFVVGISSWYQALATASIILVNFMGDALLLYRLYILYASSLWVVAFPCLLFVAAFIMSIFELTASFTPGGSVFHGLGVSYGMPYYTITIGLNAIVTGLICYRLLSVSKQLESSLGKEHSKTYTNVIAIMIESALPFTLLGIATIIPYALQHDTAIAIGQVWAKFMCLSPQLIVLRVVMGKAWSKETVNRYMSTVAFTNGSLGTSTLPATPYAGSKTKISSLSSEKFTGSAERV